MEPEKKPTTELSQKNTEPISFFSKDAGFTFVFKKTEKLASAVYMVTSLMSENEPIKWTLRKKVSDLLSLTIKYKDIGDSEQPDFVYEVRTHVLEIVSLLEISYHGKLISGMNFTVLKQEFSHLLDTFGTSNGAPKQAFNTSIPQDFLEVEEQENLSKNREYIRENTSHFHAVSRPSFTQINTLKDRGEMHPQTELLKRSSRQNLILNLLKKKKEITIKDVAQVIKGCSEKTLQRELNSFISMGVLKRSGVRRWSKYSLA